MPDDGMGSSQRGRRGRGAADGPLRTRSGPPPPNAAAEGVLSIYWGISVVDCGGRCWEEKVAPPPESTEEDMAAEQAGRRR
jgi:hypothetical protein